jgi:hypothetical protein
VTLEDFEDSEDHDDFKHDRLTTEVGLGGPRQQKSKRIRESNTVIGFGSGTQDTRSRYVSEYGGTPNANTRKSVALTNHTAMTASRMPVVRKDPNEEFFKMTLLAYKLNNAKKRRVAESKSDGNVCGSQTSGAALPQVGRVDRIVLCPRLERAQRK